MDLILSTAAGAARMADRYPCCKLKSDLQGTLGCGICALIKTFRSKTQVAEIPPNSVCKMAVQIAAGEGELCGAPVY
jgi:hypothetical protein